MSRHLRMDARWVLASSAVLALLLFVAQPAAGDQQWQPYDGNPVFTAAAVGWDNFGVSQPSVIKDGDIYRLYYQAGLGNSSAIGLATSADGVHWMRYAGNPVLVPSPFGWDNYAVSKPFVMKDGAVYRMWYTGGTFQQTHIGYATSPDGVTWTKQGTAPVLSNTPGAWDGEQVRAPYVLRDGYTYKMYYVGSKGYNTGIGLALSEDGVTWTKDGASPVLAPTPGGWDENGVGDLAVAILNGSYHMWYWSNSGLGYATSPDGFGWSKQGSAPVFSLPVACGVSSPSILADWNSSTLHMWYSSGCDNTVAISYATSVSPVDLPTLTPTLSPTPTLTGTPPVYDKIVHLPIAIKNIPPPTPTPTRTVTPSPTATPPPGWWNVFGDGFEGEFPGNRWLLFDALYDTGEYFWGKTTCEHWQGDYSVNPFMGGSKGFTRGCYENYPNNQEQWMIAGPFNMANAQAGQWKTTYRLNTQPYADPLCWLVSNDGRTFNGVCQTVSIDHSPWSERVIDFRNVPGKGNIMGSPQVWIALVFASDLGDSRPYGAYVDNVIVNKCTWNCPAPAAATTVENGTTVQIVQKEWKK